MVSLLSPAKTQQQLAQNLRERRLLMELTQEGLAQRAGVPLPTLRKFEQKGLISLESFLKLLAVVGGLEEIVAATKPVKPAFTSIDEVLQQETGVKRKRGRRK